MFGLLKKRKFKLVDVSVDVFDGTKYYLVTLQIDTNKKIKQKYFKYAYGYSRHSSDGWVRYPNFDTLKSDEIDILKKIETYLGKGLPDLHRKLKDSNSLDFIKDDS